MQKKEKIKVDDTQCRTCEYGAKGIYVCRNQYMCDYFDKTGGHLRLCEPSPNCIKYKPRKRGKESDKEGINAENGYPEGEQRADIKGLS